MRNGQQDGPPSPTLVVGIAAGGGVDSLKRLLRALPATTRITFLLIPPFASYQDGQIAQLVAQCSVLPVLPVKHDAVLAPGNVYVVEPESHVSLKNGRLQVDAPRGRRRPASPIDFLFRSLARALGSKAAAIVLSGAGRNGIAGLRALRSAGGLTMAEASDSAVQEGVVLSAIEAGVVDLALPVEKMPEVLDRFISLPHALGVQEAAADASAPAQSDEASRTYLDQPTLERLSAILQAGEAGGEFAIEHYKPTTVSRRFLRRMGLAGFADTTEYLDFLGKNTAEQQAFIRDLLIGVTEFFRDPKAFAILQTEAIATIVQEAAARSTIRIWVPGCATGEEAYSLAIAFLEAIQAAERGLSLQVFATDVDEEALAVARAGIYPPSIGETISAARLHTFFTPVSGRGFQVHPRLRNAVSFAAHDLYCDPPFSRMDLISCRNVLIYFHASVQEMVLRTLHFALMATGYLFLGPSESLGNLSELFTTVSKPWRLFRRLPGPKPKLEPAKDRTQGAALRTLVTSRLDSRRSNAAGLSVTELARTSILHSRVPPTVVVAGDGRVIYTHGELSEYLHYPHGEPRFDLLADLREDLVTRVRSALYKCRRDMSTVTVLSSPGSGHPGQVKITVSPAPKVGEGAAIVTFEPVLLAEQKELSPGSSDAAMDAADAVEQGAIIDQLERELQATREDLRSTVEELDSANEELQTVHEESSSFNEELQAANEELEASTEELRSLNEELLSVNTKLRDKVDELEQARSDLLNFFASTKLATLFLDDELRIKRLTPAAEGLLGLSKDDCGRFIGEIGRTLLQEHLAEDVGLVLEHFISRSREVAGEDGGFFVRRVLPYRTESRHIEGVVVTWTDVTEQKQTTRQLAVRERQQAVIARLGLRALESNDLPLFMEQVVREVQQTLGTDLCKILQLQPDGQALLLKVGIGWNPGYVGNATVSAGPDSQAGYTLSLGSAVVVDNLATEKRFSGPPVLHEHGVVSGISCVISGHDGEAAYGVLGAHTRTLRTFTSDDANFLQAVANVLASAIGRKQARQRLAIERGIAKALSEARNLSELAPELFAVFEQEISASVCELWMPELSPGQGQADDMLVCHSHFTLEEPHQPGAFRRLFADRRFARHEGIIGRVWALGHAEWLTNAGDESQFARAAIARELGIRSGFAFPIICEREVCGVLSVLTRRRLIHDRALLHSLETVGRSIGEFLRRVSAEEETRRSEERLRLAVDAAAAVVYETEIRSERILSMHGVEQLLGEGLTTPIRSSWWLDRVHPDDRARCLEVVENTKHNAQTAWLLTYRLRHSDGHYVHIEDHGRLIGEGTGQPRRIGVLLDVTRAKEAQERLRQSEKSFRTLAEAIPHLVWTAGKDGTTDYCNLRTLSFAGRSPEDLYRPGAWLDSTHPDDRATARAAWQRAIETKSEYRCDVRLLRAADGAYLWHAAHAVPMRDEGGEVVRWFGTATNIHERKVAEDRLRASELRLQGTFESSPLGMAFATLDGRITRSNDALLTMLGYRRADEMSLFTMSPSEFADRDRASLEKLRTNGHIGPDERALLRQDKRRITALLSAAMIGVEEEFVFFLVDITAQKRAEIEMSKLAAIVESSDDAILSKDLGGTIQSWNRGAQELYGYSAEEILGRTVNVLVPPELAEEHSQIMNRLTRGERIDQYETVRLRKDGRRLEVSVTISPIKDRWGQIVAASTVARDITERKRAEAALREADRQKNEFLAMLGHELRNPLAAIRSASELLVLSQIDDERVRRTQGVLSRQTAHMIKLIDGLLDISRIVRGKITLEKEVVDVMRILRNTLQDQGEEIERRGLVLVADITEEPVWVLGDQVRLTQVFNNLLANSIKFTQEPGTITVTARREGTSAVVVVRDTGVGIAPDFLPQIFQPFLQAAQPLDRSIGGLGLGLALVKGILDLHDGEVSARSEGLGKGAEFYVRLPATEAPMAKPARKEVAQVGQRLLVVEDNVDMAELLRDLLLRAGHDVAVAHSGEQALAMARDFVPEVILCDIGLPHGMSGYELAQAIRNIKALQGAFLVAVTGYGRPEDRKLAVAAGFDAHLTKPVDVTQIHELLARRAR